MLRIVKGFAPWILFDFFEEKFSISIGVPGGPLGFMRLIRVGILQISRHYRALNVVLGHTPYLPGSSGYVGLYRQILAKMSSHILYSGVSSRLCWMTYIPYLGISLIRRDHQVFVHTILI